MDNIQRLYTLLPIITKSIHKTLQINLTNIIHDLEYLDLYLSNNIDESKYLHYNKFILLIINHIRQSNSNVEYNNIIYIDDFTNFLEYDICIDSIFDFIINANIETGTNILINFIKYILCEYLYISNNIDACLIDVIQYVEMLD